VTVSVVATYRGATLPQGITAPATLGDAFGGSTWSITDLIVGSSRYNAATVLTVSTTGAQGRTDLLAHLATHAAGSVDHVIKLPVGTISGATITLPAKVDSTKHCWIVNTDVHAGTFATARGTKVPASTAGMAIIQGPASVANSVVNTASSGSCRGYSFHGIVIQNDQSSAAYDLTLAVVDIRSAATRTTLADFPGRVYFDRCWLRGSPTTDCRRGIYANGPYLWAEDSRITEIHYVGSEAAGIGGFDGAKFHQWVNLTIEAGSQTILYGGADPSQPQTNTLDPSDIFCDRVYGSKSLTWLRSHGTYAGVPWTVKTGFEAKNVRRWVIDRSVSQNCWPDAQAGYAMLFQNLSDNNTNHLENRIEDVVVRHHRFDYIAQGLNILSRVAYGGGTLPVNKAQRLVFDNILMTKVGGNSAGTDTVIKNNLGGTYGRAFQLLSDIDTITLDRFTTDGRQLASLDGSGGSSWTLTNMVNRLGQYGVFRSGGLVGMAALNASAATNLTVDGNVGFDLTDVASGSYTPNWYYAGANTAMLFADYAGYDYSLTSAHLTRGVGGGVPGCDTVTLATQLTGVTA